MLCDIDLTNHLRTCSDVCYEATHLHPPLWYSFPARSCWYCRSPRFIVWSHSLPSVHFWISICFFKRNPCFCRWPRYLLILLLPQSSRCTHQHRCWPWCHRCICKLWCWTHLHLWFRKSRSSHYFRNLSFSILTERSFVLPLLNFWIVRFAFYRLCLANRFIHWFFIMQALFHIWAYFWHSTQIGFCLVPDVFVPSSWSPSVVLHLSRLKTLKVRSRMEWDFVYSTFAYWSGSTKTIGLAENFSLIFAF